MPKRCKWWVTYRCSGVYGSSRWPPPAGYFESAIQALGSWWQQVEVVGVVPRPVRRESLLETSNKVRRCSGQGGG